MSKIHVYVRNERNVRTTDANTLVHNRFPTVVYSNYHKGMGYSYKTVDYADHWGNRGLHNASLTSLYNLKRICVKARDAVENYEKNPKEKYRLEIYYAAAPASLKAAVNAGIITGTPASKEHINKKYVNMDDPSDVITIDKWERKKAVYCARLDVNYNEIIEELNKTIRGVLEAFNG